MPEPTLSIPRDVIEPIITAHVAAAVTQALSGHDRLISKVVAEVLNQKVSEDGTPGRGYSGESAFIIWAMRDCVRKACKQAIEHAMSAHGEAIKKNIVAELTKRNSPHLKALAEGMANGVFHPDNLKWRLTINACKD